jgi:hypothetical protein
MMKSLSPLLFSFFSLFFFCFSFYYSSRFSSIGSIQLHHAAIDAVTDTPQPTTIPVYTEIDTRPPEGQVGDGRGTDYAGAFCSCASSTLRVHYSRRLSND